MARRTFLLAAALAGLLVPGAAGAATWELPRPPLAGGAGLVLAGDRVAWLEPRRGDSGADLYVARPARDPRRVQSFPAHDEARYELAASRSRMAVLRRRDEALEVFAGAVGSRLTRIHGCTKSATSPRVDVEARLVAVTGCAGRVIVRDLDGAGPDLVLGTAARDAQIAGRYVAWVERDGRRVVVHDLERDRTSYEVEGARVRALALQGNGKTGFAVERSDGLQVLGWATRKQPTVHGLHMANRFAYFPRMADGRIAFGRDAVKATESDAREVGFTDLWSGHVLVLSRHLSGTRTIDFDGETIAYAVRRGRHGARVRTRTAPPPEPRPEPGR
jgi:hypothetical protein